MRGDEWNRLVGVPTPADVEAALADVRVRAVPIARRYARKRRVVSFLIAVLAMGGAFWAGQLNLVGSLGIGVDWPDASMFRLLPAGAPPPHLPVNRAGEATRRYRITSWSELSGERFAESESWVEGPAGTEFMLGYWPSRREAARYFAAVRARVTDSTVEYRVQTSFRARRPSFRRGHQVIEEANAFVKATATRGQPVLLYPFGTAAGGDPIVVVRIEGPDLPEPAVPLPWRLPPAAAGLSFVDMGASVVQEVEQARLRGARVARPRPGALYAVPMLALTPVRLRFSIANRLDFGEYTAAPLIQRVIVPGLRDTLVVSLRTGSLSGAHTCFNARRGAWHGAELDRQAGEQPFKLEGCFPIDDPWTPIEVTSNSGHRLRVQLLPVDDRARAAQKAARAGS